MSLDTELSAIHKAVTKGHVLWKKHALERMLERSISRLAVKRAIAHGVIIEQYPNDYPVPSLISNISSPIS